MKFSTSPDGRLVIVTQTPEEFHRWSSPAVKVTTPAPIQDDTITMVSVSVKKSPGWMSRLLKRAGFIHITGMVLLKEEEEIIVFSRSVQAEYGMSGGFVSISLPCGEVWVGMPTPQKMEDLVRGLALKPNGFSWAELDAPLNQAEFLGRIADPYCDLPDSQRLLQKMLRDLISEAKSSSV